MSKDISTDVSRATECFLSKALSSYRLTAAIAILTPGGKKQNKEAAWKFVIDCFMDEYKEHMSPSAMQATINMLAFRLLSLGDWAKYVAADMVKYADMVLDGEIEEAGGELDIEKLCMKHYHSRMEAQAKLIFMQNDVFLYHGLEEYYVLDIGCGTMPYFKIMCRNAWVSSRIKEYIGIDKREVTGYPDDSRIRFLQHSFEDFMCNRATTEEYKKTNYILLCEFLHCVEDPEHIIKSLMLHFPNLKTIKIVEVKPDSSLGFGFDFHMKMHTEGISTEINEEMLGHLAYKHNLLFDRKDLSTQHVVYSLDVR